MNPADVTPSSNNSANSNNDKTSAAGSTAPSGASASKSGQGKDATQFARPNIKQRKWPHALIWIVPLIVAVIAGLYLRDYLATKGPEITIEFSDASGLREGETRVLHRGAEIGRVSGIELTDDARHALVHVTLQKREDAFATKGAAYWIVRPEVSKEGLSGLGTLFSGPYINAVPGTEESRADEKREAREEKERKDGRESKDAKDSDKADAKAEASKDEENMKTEFVGMQHPPHVIEAGERFVLTTPHLGHVQEGSAVLYRGIQVGTVNEVELDKMADHLDVHITVWTRYAALVRANSKFWTASGFDFKGGLFSGAELQLGNLSTLISGGVAFATPDKDMKEVAKSGTQFVLEDTNNKDWDKWAPKIQISPRGGDAVEKKVELPAAKQEKKSQ